MTFAICNEIFQGWKLDEVFGFASKLGYDAVEIAPFTLAKDARQIGSTQRMDIRASAKRRGIAISGIHWVLAHTEGFHVTHPDSAVREKTGDYLVELVDLCADLGGGFMIVGSPKQRSLLPGISYEQGWSWAADTFTRPVRRAEDRGVTICFEPLAPSETNFVNTAAEAIRFADQFHSPNARIILDVKAMSSESKPIPEIIRDAAPHFAYFHANDKNLKGPGFGEIDFKPIAGALKTAGYTGVVSVEVFDFTEGPDRIATGSLETLRTAFGQLPQ